MCWRFASESRFVTFNFYANFPWEIRTFTKIHRRSVNILDRRGFSDLRSTECARIAALYFLDSQSDSLESAQKNVHGCTARWAKTKRISMIAGGILGAYKMVARYIVTIRCLSDFLILAVILFCASNPTPRTWAPRLRMTNPSSTVPSTFRGSPLSNFSNSYSLSW
jgi:hypothetical protein